MDRKVKYFIFVLILIINLLIHMISPNLWRIIFSTLFIVFIFDQFETIFPLKIRKIICCLTILFCFIDGYIGLKNNNWINVYGSFGLFLILILFFLKPLLQELSHFCFRNEHNSLTLKITNLYTFVYRKEPYILTIKGATLNLLGKFNEALECLEESEELGYKEPFLYANLGYAWISLEDLEKGYQYYKLAVDNNPTDMDSLYNISALLINLGKYDEALQYIDKVLEWDADNETFNYLKNFIEKSRKENL